MNKNRKVTEQAVVVILAAGKGIRMGREDIAKVCFEINGVPAIVRLIRTFKERYFSKFLVVVGYMSEQVVDAVSRVCPGAMFVHQSPQLGTGHAGKVAAEELEGLGHTGPVVVTMGDKYLKPVAVDMLVEGFVREEADLVLLTVPKSKKESATGYVFIDKDGQAVDIIERIDLARQSIVDELQGRLKKGEPISCPVVKSVIEKHISDMKKAARAVPELLELVEESGRVSERRVKQILSLDKYNLCVDGRRYSARQIKRVCTQFHPSLYLFKAEAFYKGVSMIDDNNAQGEYYLTDVVKHLSSITDESGERRFKVRTVLADSAEVIRGFNSLKQLLSLQD